jgi:hypothetical protein
MSYNFGIKTPNVKMNFAPLLNFDVKSIFPPNFSMIYFEITSPIPIPSVFIFFFLSFIDPNNLNSLP